MSRDTLLQRLRPGLDPNGSTWSILRYPADWKAGTARGVSYDHTAGGICLSPTVSAAAPGDMGAGWSANQPVVGLGGTTYRIDTATCRLLAKHACDATFAPLRGIGGRGFATGQFNAPTSVAVDALGRLYVADTGNARVQVILPDTGEVLAVLEQGLSKPVHVAISRHGAIWIADKATRSLHGFTARFAAEAVLPLRTLDPWTGAEWEDQPPPDPRAVTLLSDGSLGVLDPARPLLWHMDSHGEPLPALPWPSEALLPAGWQPLPASYAANGEIVLGPIDGGVPNLAWHKVMLDAFVPESTRIEVQTFAAENDGAPVFRWAPSSPVPLRTLEAASGETDRLVLPDTAAWTSWRAGRIERAQPLLHGFAGDGPSGTDSFTLPAEVARKLRSSDLVAFETAAGGHETARIIGLGKTPVILALAGPGPAFAGDGPIALAERAGQALPYGKLDLAFLGVARSTLGLAAVPFDGLPQVASLPHDFAMALRSGDILETDDGAGVIEVLEFDDAPVLVTLEQPLSGDFSTADLRLVESGLRLIGTATVPDSFLPQGTTLTVLGDVHSAQPIANLIADGAIWLAAPLVGQVDTTNWLTARFPEPVATDRGRYLWVRLRLTGRPVPPGNGIDFVQESSATPIVRALRLIAPRPSLIDFLPALYARSDTEAEAPGAGFLERFLTLFEGDLTRIEASFDSVSRLLNPAAADVEWLDFVGSWLDIAFDPSWSIERRRQLVREAHALKAGQGTPGALRRYLDIYTGSAVDITEQFQLRPPPPIQLGARGALGVAPLGSSTAQDDEWARPLAHRFRVSLSLPAGEARAAIASGARRIIETMKPAHTQFTLDTRGGTPARIGMGQTIGTITIPGSAADPCRCDPDPAADHTRRGHVAGGFLIGGRLAVRKPV